LWRSAAQLPLFRTAYNTCEPKTFCEAHAHTHRAHLQPEIWERGRWRLSFRKIDLSEPIGEAWLTVRNARLLRVPLRQELGEAWKEMPVEWRGEQLAAVMDFPLLVKFIFPTDKLSIQVIPTMPTRRS